MRPVPWSVVAIVGIVVGGLVAVMLAGKETGALFALGALILGGLGFSVAQQHETKQNVNGNMSRMLTLVEGMHRDALDAAAAAPPPVVQLPDDKAA